MKLAKRCAQALGRKSITYKGFKIKDNVNAYFPQQNDRYSIDDKINHGGWVEKVGVKRFQTLAEAKSYIDSIVNSRL